MAKLKFKSKKKGRKRQSKFNKFLLLTMIISLFAWSIINSSEIVNPPKEVTVSQFENDVENGTVLGDDVIVSGDRIEYKVLSPKKRYAFFSNSEDLISFLEQESLNSLNVFEDAYELVTESEFRDDIQNNNILKKKIIVSVDRLSYETINSEYRYYNLQPSFDVSQFLSGGNAQDYILIQDNAYAVFNFILRRNIKSGLILNNNIIVSGNRIQYELTNIETRFAFKEEGALLQDILTEEQIEGLDLLVDPINYTMIRLIETAIYAVFAIAVLMFFLSKVQSGNNKAMMFGSSKARVHDKTKDKTTFKDVAGALEAKEELEEVVDFLKNPKKYQKIGAKIPKGVLLVGPPGTGKTLLARAVAGEASVPFFSISGSEFVEMFVGVGASRVRDMFKKAKRNAPCIIFIDEIDAVGRKRGAGLGGGHDEREQTLNQILTEMDGFEQGSNVIIMAATNRPDVLDPALLRPGRFDRRVTVDSPGIKDREAILKVHAKNKPLAKSANLKTIAAHTPGMTGADLENILNEAAIYTAKNNKKTIGQKALEEAVEKVLMGPARKSKIMNDKEKKITAYHEVGHALVGHMLSECDPVHKVSVVSRGRALGVTLSLPEDDVNMYSKTKFEHKLAMMMGGYVAEEVFFGETSTGPSNDLERATAIAKRMVMEFGMSELGPVAFGEKKHEVFLGKDMAHTKNYSEAMAQKIDDLIKGILHKAYDRAKEIITEYKGLMTEISEDLLEKENLSRKEFIEYFEKAGVKTPLPN